MKVTIEKMIEDLERYGCPENLSESIAIGLVCEIGYTLPSTSEENRCPCGKINCPIEMTHQLSPVSEQERNSGGSCWKCGITPPMNHKKWFTEESTTLPELPKNIKLSMNGDWGKLVLKDKINKIISYLADLEKRGEMKIFAAFFVVITLMFAMFYLATGDYAYSACFWINFWGLIILDKVSSH